MLVAHVADPTVGQRLQLLLNHLGLSQEELARQLRRLGSKTGSSLISLWCTGGRHMSFYSMAAVSLFHDQPHACLRWLATGKGEMPQAFSFPRAAAQRGLSLPREPEHSLGAEGREMHRSLSHAIEYTIRENQINFANSGDLTKAMIRMAEALEAVGEDSTHMWLAISYIKVRAAELRRGAVAEEGPSAIELDKIRDDKTRERIRKLREQGVGDPEDMPSA